MSVPLIGATLAGSAAGSLVFSALTYSLRDLSRAKLSDLLDRRGANRWIEPTLEAQSDLVFVTAVFRLLFNAAILVCSLLLLEELGYLGPAGYGLAILIGTAVSLVSSVMLPTAVAHHAGDSVVAAMPALLHALWRATWPLAKLMRLLDRLVVRIVGASAVPRPERIGQEIQQEILSAVSEGAKEGVVDEEEREMIESVISFRDTTAAQIMTPRPEVVAIEATATLAEIKAILEESGLSRIPVYEETLDQVVGILYARDLLKQLGKPAETFSLRSAVRPPFVVPETKPLRDLLHDFRQQKVHIAIVLDEYGGTAGLVTIEDVLEELVGDISDEHEPPEPAQFHKLDEHTFEADARLHVDEFNRLAGADLPEDDGYETIGGFVSTTVGRIPPAGTAFDHGDLRFTVLKAEPQRVNRVRAERKPTAAAAGAHAKGTGSAKAAANGTVKADVTVGTKPPVPEDAEVAVAVAEATR
jgi:putative hemolysin